MAAKKVPSKSLASKKSTRRSPISRAEGEERLIQAAIILLKGKAFSSVGVREIATLADVNQGFIHHWFGSQNDLYLRVIQELFIKLAAKMGQQVNDAVAINPFDENVRFAVRLLLWLDLEGVDVSPVKPQLDQLMEAFRNRLLKLQNLDKQAADALMMQGSAIGFGLAAFGHILGTDDIVRFANAVGFWRHQVELLSKNPRQ